MPLRSSGAWTKCVRKAGSKGLFGAISPRIMWFTLVYPWFRALKRLGLSPELDATGKRKRLRPFGPEAWLAESRERILRRRRRSKKENALWVAV